MVVDDNSMFWLADRGQCQCVRAEVVCAKSLSSMTNKPGTIWQFHRHLYDTSSVNSA